jgi:putative SOS response-associated peptidase YedK
VCGRYRLSQRKQLVEEYFGSVSGEEEWTPRYTIAPTQPIPVIRQNPKEPVRELSLMRWGTHSILVEGLIGRGEHALSD